MAETIGVSNGTLSYIQNEVLDKVNESMLLKVKSFFRVNNSWVNIETANFETIIDECDNARNKKLMIAIVGYAGAGKTTALRHYYETNPNTYLVTCGRAMRTKQFLKEILKALGVSYLASDYEMIQVIINELNRKKDPLLIFDEASKLSTNALMYLQDINDGIVGNGGIVLAGVDYLLNHIKTGAEKNKLGMAEFYGRVTSWIIMEEPTKREIEAICINNGVHDKDKINQMSRFGSFRYVYNVIMGYDY